jgi:hypothetical protein
VENFVDWFNEEHDLSWVDGEEIAMIQHYSHKHKETMSNPAFATLSDNNPIKQRVIKIAELREKYNKIYNILSCFENEVNTDDKNVSLPNDAQEFILSHILGSWGENITMYLKVAKEMEK